MLLILHVSKNIEVKIFKVARGKKPNFFFYNKMAAHCVQIRFKLGFFVFKNTVSINLVDERSIVQQGAVFFIVFHYSYR